ncbi:hypothetical protein PNEG_04293 [Pneumocystis murina B123]|uniref:COP9 signalosome complex subunit 4 n=1 Tax=Pneumocystis murina (strain B123) TaxID=1069680 RepID=A0A0W4ZX20_PNEMU|nr:hypothetical protein PNEG_04293 [Pneumocystis murina B123]KTW32906.1 hypothetical protein PNEG_04293 [Pneumocystis murina B123]
MKVNLVKDASNYSEECFLLKITRFPEELEEFEQFLIQVFSNDKKWLNMQKILEQCIEHLDLIEDVSVKKKVLEMILSKTQFKILDIELVYKMKEKLAKIYEDACEYHQVVKILQEIALESSEWVFSDNYKLKIYVWILQNLLEIENMTLFNTYFEKAAYLDHDTCEPELLFRFKLIQANFLDKSQKFLEASKKYYELSAMECISEIQRLEYLDAAIICIALSPVCPTRSKILSTFYENYNSVNFSNYFILEKLHFRKILFPREIKEFQKKLKPYQNIELEDGTTVFMRAVIEHNLLSISKLYYNISFSELSDLLGISVDMTQDYVAKMIEQGIISAKIDHISELVLFDNINQNSKIEMTQWDDSIRKICMKIENISSKISLNYNDYMTFKNLLFLIFYIYVFYFSPEFMKF